MKIQNIRYLARGLSRSGKQERFINFARGASLVSVIIGTLALIISLSILSGFEKSLLENAVKFTSHISVFTMSGKPIDNYPPLINHLKKTIPELTGIAPLIEKEGLLSDGKKVEGIIVRGINLENDITGIRKQIIEGNSYFSKTDSRELIIGKRLKDKFRLQIGDEVIIYSVYETLDFEMPDAIIGKFKIIGIYETGMAKYDDVLIYAPYDAVTNFFRMNPNSASAIEITIKDIKQIEQIAMRINENLEFPYMCRTVFELHRSIFAWIELQKEPIPIVLGLISIVAILNIFTTLLIIVVEKTHSIGILRSLGLKTSNILSIFILQGLTLAFLGSIIGCILAYLFYIIQSNFKIIRLQGDVYFLDFLPVNFEPIHYIIVIIISLTFALLATIIPSIIATKVSPIKAIRFK